MKNENRWKQRFANFEKAYTFFKRFLDSDTASNELLRAGLIQAFEFTFELAWKTMKDKLEYGGIEVKLPRDVIQEAFHAGYITDDAAWIDALQKRNEMSHLYNEQMTKKTEELIRKSFAPILELFYVYFKKSL
ncbi:MAG: HI0074 family nucleotidyltransferase substrate-binding subunit [Patescibacteria group bacterium]